MAAGPFVLQQDRWLPPRPSLPATTDPRPIEHPSLMATRKAGTDIDPSSFWDFRTAMTAESKSPCPCSVKTVSRDGGHGVARQTVLETRLRSLWSNQRLGPRRHGEADVVVDCGLRHEGRITRKVLTTKLHERAECPVQLPNASLVYVGLPSVWMRLQYRP